MRGHFSHVKAFVGIVPTNGPVYACRVDPNPSDPPSPLLSATARLLRPLVRLLIRSGVAFPVLTDVLRGVYVDVARQMLPDEKARTDSRLSVMTGIHRKELRRSREAGGTPQPQPPTVAAQVAARWLGLPGLQDAAGQPIPLPRAAPDGQPSFESLVAGVTRDVRARAVLDDWLGQGLVVPDADGRLVLQAAAFLPRPGSGEQFFYLGRNLHDHLAAAAANVGPDRPADGSAAPFLDRSVHYDGLSAAAATSLAGVAREAAIRMLLDVNRQALAIAEQDDAAADPDVPRRHRVNLGAYLFDATEDG